MYRPQIILARNISIEMPGRRSSPEIAAANRDPSRATAIGLNPSIVVHGSWKVRSTKDRCVSGSRQSSRGITALSV